MVWTRKREGGCPELDFGVPTHFRQQALAGKFCCDPLVSPTLDSYVTYNRSESRAPLCNFTHPARTLPQHTGDSQSLGLCFPSSSPSSVLLQLPFLLFIPFLSSSSSPHFLPLLESCITLQSLQKYTVNNRDSGLGSVSPRHNRNAIENV